jgi:RimJ/RimL family protein N-acetyltransferase
MIQRRTFWGHKRWILYAGLILGLGGEIGYLVWQHYRPQPTPTCQGIALYDIQRDRQEILRLFKENWYWLIPEDTPFSAEQFLDPHLLNRTGENKDASKIFVYCLENRPIGFVAYYKQSPTTARLRFIAVDQPYRGKGYSQELMNAALDDMKKEGITKVNLITRTNNQPARKLYTRLGFKQIEEEDGYVHFEKSL